MAKSNRNILDSLPIIGSIRETNRQNKELKEIVARKSWAGSSGFSSGLSYSGSPVSSLFMETLMSGHQGKNYNVNPRLMLDTYKGIFYSFPVFTAAISVRKKAMGQPVLVNKDKGAQRDLDWITKNLPVTNWKNPYKMQKGLCSLKDRLYTGSLMNGTSFCQTKRDESMNPVSVELFNSEWFDVCKNMYHVTEFYFNSENGRVHIKPDGDFQIYSQTVGDFDWGMPLAYGAEFMAWAALGMIVSRLSYERRIGNPATETIVAGDIRDKTTGNVDDSLYNTLVEKVQNIKEAHRIGINHSNTTFQSYDLFDFFPLDAKIDHHTFGNGVSGSSQVKEIIEMFFDQLILKTETPAFLLNAASPGGMNTDLYREQRGQFTALIKGDREGIEHHLLTPAFHWLMANKASPATIKGTEIMWDAPNVNDLKLEADTKFVSAQATGQQLMNLAGIMDGTGGGKSKLLLQYLKEIGWDEAIAAELDFSIEETKPDPKE